MKRSKGFTLIELLAVILILAAIALIATPMVSNYITESKEKANETSVASILRAADNFYYKSKITKNVTYPKEFIFPNDYDELKLSGEAPDFGQLIIYGDGQVSLEILYDDVHYSKYKEEKTIVKNRKVVEKDSLWTTSGTGVLIAYNTEINLNDQVANIQKQINYFLNYLIFSVQYASQNTLGNYGITVPSLDLTKTLRQNVSVLETNGTLDSRGLPDSLKQELDKIIDIYLNVKSDYNGAVAILSSKTDIPHTLDALTKYINGNQRFEDYSSYYEIVLSYKLIIPNYVEHEGGKLEKINEIGDSDKSIKAGIVLGNVIISNGIKKINDNAFIGSLVTNVTIPNTVEQIGNDAFNSSSIRDLIIPGSVKKIGNGCFYGNNMKTLTLSEGLEEIGDHSFESNYLETVKLPLSLKKVGYQSFASNPLQKVYKYRNASYRAESTSFGNPGTVTFEYID